MKTGHASATSRVQPHSTRRPARASPGGAQRVETIERIVSDLGHLKLARNSRGEMRTVAPGRWAPGGAMMAYHGFARGLSERARGELTEYATGASYPMNRLLEGRSTLPEATNAEFRERIDIIKKVLADAPRAPGGLVVFRALSRDAGALQPGARIEEKGFSSTALKPYDALSFFDYQSDNADNFDQTEDFAKKTLVLRIIHLPKGGYPALYVPSVIGKDFVDGKDDIGDEHEMLLPPGATFEVIRNRRMEWYAGRNMEKRPVVVEEVRLLPDKNAAQRAK
jgi:hypothetical protein